ncbi:TetR/AcrR family transcriptional regulator [Marinobacter sp. CA1]|uniref:TetR/AcrR family transcriptional regulator n=1 Tax=Marinobacter sp. CA1 TaxID=2817656 RepID=UPI001D0741C8|nr:TetR/AcrR family transcriptional regulator [Marinobacter sp. CA1]UDL06417.1 TetR/AcrR family transcriptional regulator [Marinobacter sp. CA1]
MSGRPRQFDAQAVIDAAMEVFWQHGYEGTSAQALCEGTGLGRGSLYNAFGSKQQLFEQALRRYQDLGLQAQLEILNRDDSVRHRLRALMEWGITADLDPNCQRSCMALRSVLERNHQDPVVKRINDAYLDRIERRLTELMTEGQQLGELRTDQPPRQLARGYMAGYYGLRVLGQSRPEREFLTDIVNDTLARL